MLDLIALERACRDRLAKKEPFRTKAMPRVMLELISMARNAREREAAWAPVVLAALEAREDHDRIDALDAAVANLPVDMWP